jgi:hypothetical protein
VFANKYIEKNYRLEPLISVRPDSETGIIIVIPCFQEYDILNTLKSLNQCSAPECKVEVIILINHSENASNKIKEINSTSFREIGKWIISNETKKLSFLPTKPIDLTQKWAGAGLARKKGMDEAICRLNQINKPNGIVVSLDADTLVDKNYLVEIEKYFQKNRKHVGATISFQHQINNLDPKHLKGIQLYEKYLKYYKAALSFTGYPYAMFTIGSAFTVTANAYVARGGMNRRKAGEDFYFLQSLAQQGEIGEIISTKVYPSARLSNRVPFGTGPIMQKWMDGKEDLNNTYNICAFSDIKSLFNIKEKLYKISENDFQKLLFQFPLPVRLFLNKDNFLCQLNDLNQNCSSLKTFNQRFFHIFNAFKIMKFLNYAHEEIYEKVDLEEQILKLEQLNRKK